MSNYPVLVYGTLRPSGSNYGHFLAGRTINERTVTLNGFRMFGGKGYPYVIAGTSNDKIVGTLCDIDTDNYDDVVSGLDFLEGYRGPNDDNNHYDRVLIQFAIGDEIIKAWTYLASEQVANYIVRELPVVEHGDWLKFYNDSLSIWQLENERLRRWYEVEDAKAFAKNHAKTRVSRAQKKKARKLAKVSY